MRADLFFSYSLATTVLFLCSRSVQAADFQIEDPPAEGHLTLYGAAAGGAGSGLPVATGDFDGDGFLDLVSTPMEASFQATGGLREQAGLAYILFGHGDIAGFVDFATPPEDSAVLLGARSFDITGDEV